MVSHVYPVPSAIGQGEHAYTSIGLARYVTALANSGTVYELTLLDKVVDAKGNVVLDNHAEIRNTVDLPTDYWNAIHSGMKRVVDAKTYFNELPVTAAGKTGTAQESKKRANHALFVYRICTLRKPADFHVNQNYARIFLGLCGTGYQGCSRLITLIPRNREELITGQADTPLTAQGGD